MRPVVSGKWVFGEELRLDVTSQLVKELEEELTESDLRRSMN